MVLKINCLLSITRRDRVSIQDTSDLPFYWTSIFIPNSILPRETYSQWGKSSTPRSPTMPKYPGLGLPLGHNDEPATGFYPIGAHSSCSGATSDPLPVREVAMMNIMERLTDKNDWHKKVFDEQVVCKWRKETLEIPDKDLWSLATSGKQQLFNEDGSVTVQESISIQGVDPLEGIMTETVFDYVSSSSDLLDPR